MVIMNYQFCANSNYHILLVLKYGSLKGKFIRNIDEVTSEFYLHNITINQAPVQPLMKQCPLCQQQIAEYSNPCPHCGGELQ